MELKIISSSEKELEFEIVGGEYTLAELLTTRLNGKKGVEFASYRVAHPLVANPRIYVRVSSGKAAKLVSETLDEIREEVAEFRDSISKGK
ncbi:MAG: DNA-directed RNA polymerase subunit L [Candidatus ainarchaeum sp.]|nr:DNA-directed RNA polymerase subunit L [Candidatus ainarchaeum sp.]MDD5096469.1 DNA-directed RNA polymerase subunit L [Candidatus ainarchaeum sp.]